MWLMNLSVGILDGLPARSRIDDSGAKMSLERPYLCKSCLRSRPLCCNDVISRSARHVQSQESNERPAAIVGDGRATDIGEEEGWMECVSSQRSRHQLSYMDERL